MKDADEKKHAVVLSGGGANGAFEVGVMKALFNGLSPATGNQPLQADIFTGTSVGAYNAAMMASQPGVDPRETVGYLEDLWLNRVADNADQCGNGVFRFRGGVSDAFDLECLARNPLKPVTQLAQDGVYLARDFLRRGSHFFQASGTMEHRTLELFNLSSFVSTEPLKQLIHDTVSLEDIQKSEKELRVVATNWETGEAQVFKKDQLIGEVGYGAILASTAIPGFFPHVEVSGEFYVDGGVVMNTPLMPAIEAGADVIHIIFLDPEVKAIPIERLENTLDTLDRMLAIQFALNINADIEKAARINRGLDAIERVLQGGAPEDAEAKAFVQAVARIEQHLADRNPYRKIRIHCYHPRDDLSGVLGLLKFDRDRISDLIDRGVQDAVEHDCSVCGCC